MIVVGAGPGGSAAAYHLARHGLRVLLLEKTEFPREKVCGDGLTPRATRQLIRMGVDTSDEGRLAAEQGPAGDRRRRPARAGLAGAGQLPQLRPGPHPAGLRRPAGQAGGRGRRAAADRRQRDRARCSTATAGSIGVEAEAGAGQGARRRTARRWWSRRTACPAGSRSRWAWPSATTGRSAWRCAATTSSPVRARRRLPGVLAGAAQRTGPATSCCPGTAGSSGWVTAGSTSGLGVLNSSSAFGKTNYRAMLTDWLGHHARPTGA